MCGVTKWDTCGGKGNRMSAKPGRMCHVEPGSGADALALQILNQPPPERVPITHGAVPGEVGGSLSAHCFVWVEERQPPRDNSDAQVEGKPGSASLCTKCS